MACIHTAFRAEFETVFSPLFVFVMAHAAISEPAPAKPNLGQKEAKLEKKDAELERLSEEQLRHMEGGDAAKSVRHQKTKEESK